MSFWRVVVRVNLVVAIVALTCFSARAESEAWDAKDARDLIHAIEHGLHGTGHDYDGNGKIDFHDLFYFQVRARTPAPAADTPTPTLPDATPTPTVEAVVPEYPITVTVNGDTDPRSLNCSAQISTNTFIGHTTLILTTTNIKLPYLDPWLITLSIVQFPGGYSGEGTYTLAAMGGGGNGMRYDPSTTGDVFHETDATHTGTLTITRDNGGDTIQGTIVATLAGNQGGTIQIEAEFTALAIRASI